MLLTLRRFTFSSCDNAAADVATAVATVAAVSALTAVVVAATAFSNDGDCVNGGMM